MTIPKEHEQVHADLEAWGRWSRSRARGQSACGSAERNYRAPWRQWHYPTTEEMMPVVVRDMLAIDRAIIGIPRAYVELIKQHYFYGRAERTTRRTLGIHISAWEDHLFRARQMVLNGLQYGAKHDSLASAIAA